MEFSFACHYQVKHIKATIMIKTNFPTIPVAMSYS